MGATHPLICAPNVSLINRNTQAPVIKRQAQVSLKEVKAEPGLSEKFLAQTLKESQSSGASIPARIQRYVKNTSEDTAKSFAAQSFLRKLGAMPEETLRGFTAAAPEQLAAARAHMVIRLNAR